MPSTPSFREELISQIPALQLLINLGYIYLSPDQVNAARGGRLGNVLLDEVLERQLRKLNQITWRGRTVPFSDANIQQAILRLKNEPLDGLTRTNEHVYNLLTLGTSLPQTIDGDTKSHTLRYIDWHNPANNVYHVTDEFVVERTRSRDTRRPDIVLFVNGIPLVVIECKRPDLERSGGEKVVVEAISQMLRNQRSDEIPHLFVFAQLLLAVSTNDALYGTTETARKFWSVWTENGTTEADVHRLINGRLDAVAKRHLYGHREYAAAIQRYFDAQEAADERLPTVQDRTIYSLLRPERLLNLVYQYIVYDAGVKKIARYQQYFAIQTTIARVARLDDKRKRQGGVVWHTQGSGKSLTMVMLAKALALHPIIENPRVVLVTDRTDLDQQIWDTFHACGKKVHQAESGSDLVRVVQNGNVALITTVINKFDAAAKRGVHDPNSNIFVLIDESHRSQYGSMHAKMQRVFPNACYIAFTGTPLLRAEKATAQKFGGFIHKYTMRQAVDDQAVVPLLYEGRMAELGVDEASIDQWFERVTRDLSDDQKRDLKRKFSRNEEVSATDQRMQQIAYDITRHYADNWQGTGFKAQLAAASKATALAYKRFLDEFGEVTSDVVMPAPDTREGNDEVDESGLPAVQAFWKRMMERFGTEKNYNREIKNSFGREDGVEILIVVDKLLTGFDEPRNTVLYIDKPLQEHSLLQAIARINRLFEGKEFGYIIDYRGVLGELNAALNTYNALEGFDSADVEGMITDVYAEIAKLAEHHAALWAIFDGVPNKRDTEALERYLEPEDRRQQFYEVLAQFARTLKVALASAEFAETTPEVVIDTYKADFKFFHNLRASVRQRYAEVIDYKEYEGKVRGLLNRHIRASEVTPLTNVVNIFDTEAFAQEVERVAGNAAKADTIANRIKRTLTEHLHRDPATYRRFGQMIDEMIQSYRDGRINEVEYLKQMQETLSEVQQGAVEDVPARLASYPAAQPYWSQLRELDLRYGADAADSSGDLLADMAIALEAIIAQRKVRDWTRNSDVQNAMRNELEDYLYDLRASRQIDLAPDVMDRVVNTVIELAKQRDRNA